MDRRAPATETVVIDSRDDRFVDELNAVLPRLQRLARLLTGSAQDAEDLVAEAVARTLPRWRAGAVADPESYLRRVTVNLAGRGWKRRRLAARRDRAALDWLPTATAGDQQVAERQRVLRAVLRLPPRRRAIVALRFYDDLPEAAIAEVLGIRLGTVKSQLSRGLEQLRGELGSLEGA
jgi:RNA polymerase sigma factor (sigma-70 family)